MFLTSMTILSGDLRQCYLADYMYHLGHDVICYGTAPFPSTSVDALPRATTLTQALENSQVIVCPTPFSTDGIHLYSSSSETPNISLEDLQNALRPGQVLVGGAIPSTFISFCKDAQIPVFDILKDNSVIYANAELTAEGLLASLITETPFSLKNSHVLLLGFGNCGKEIANLLQVFHINLTIIEQDSVKCELARSAFPEATILECHTALDIDVNFNLVINTIPAKLIDVQTLEKLPANCVIFDVASAPYGFEDDLLKSTNFKIIRCPGIPGKNMPQTAGEILGKAIIERMISYGF